jgi:dolichol-phosphate mannosyltransferase
LTLRNRADNNTRDREPRRTEGNVIQAEQQAQGEPRWHRQPHVRRLLRALLSPSKFALVGIFGIFVNQAALFALVEMFGVHYLPAAVLASQVSTLNNFVLVELWVFRDRDTPGHVLWRYLTFNLLNMATLLVRVPVLYVLTDLAGVYYLISNFVAIGITFGVRYLVADNWIWAGRDRRDQKPIDGWFQYDVHGIVRIISTVHLPELAAFNVAHQVEPDIVIRRRFIGGRPRFRVANWRDESGEIHYREHFGPLSAAFDVRIGDRIELDANWLLTWSHHVLYTNMVEPLLRFVLVDRDYVLLHCAAIDAERGAAIMSAQTDTGKTSTVLRLLMAHSWGFISDDMAILTPAGEILSYPKPMTLSSHTMAAVNDQVLPWADRLMLAIRSRVHSKEGRSAGHALGRLNVPIVTINAWVQLLVPPPKYHVQSLIDCDLSDRAPIDSVVLMERGTPPLAEEPDFAFTIARLIENTDDAYTFPPFATFAPLIEMHGRGYTALRAHELELLEASVRNARRSRVRVVGHSWSEIVPTLLDRRTGELPPSVLEVAARPDDHAPDQPTATLQPSGNGTTAATAQPQEPPVVGVGGRGS